MKTTDFDFDLPKQLIAQYPPEKRGLSRLMVLDRKTGERTHTKILELPDFLESEKFISPSGEKPVMVFNDTKVRKARLIGTSLQSGAKTEFLLIEKRENGESKRHSGGCEWKVLVRRAKRFKTGRRYVFFDDSGGEIAQGEITGEDGEFRFLRFSCGIDDAWLDRYGHVPLPPYISRGDSGEDAERYQTVYAKETGSVAAATAGLHFTDELLDKIAACGIESVFITLHVGLGTFLPVRSEDIQNHIMHQEVFNIDEKTAVKIEAAKNSGRKVIAVGTTSVRTLESAWVNGRLKRGKGSTSIFIYPPYEFKVADALFTNFHTPQSTLLMLVSAFAGRELILDCYKEAVREDYRFFSYGDAMLIH